MARRQRCRPVRTAPVQPPTIDVTTTSRRARDQRGIGLQRTSVLGPGDVVTIERIPVTTVARTLVDLAAVVPANQLRRALNEAELRRALDLGAIERALERTRGRRGGGHAAMRAALAELARHGVQRTRSDLEELFEALVVDHGLPRPRLNAVARGREVDAWWPREAVAVEVDGWEAHGTRTAFQRDRAKGNALTLAGITLLRFTYADVVQRPHDVAAQLARALGA